MVDPDQFSTRLTTACRELNIDTVLGSFLGDSCLDQVVEEDVTTYRDKFDKLQ